MIYAIAERVKTREGLNGMGLNHLGNIEAASLGDAINTAMDRWPEAAKRCERYGGFYVQRLWGNDQ